MLAVVASRTRVTVPVSGSWRARAVIRGPSVSGQAGSGARPPRRARACSAGEQDVGAVDLVAGGAEVLPDRAEVGAAGDAVFHQPGGLGLVRVGAGAGVEAQLGLQRLADRAGADEPDQAAGEDRRLRPGGQPDGQPPGGDVVDGAAPGVGGGDAVADQLLVQRPDPGAGSPRRPAPGRISVGAAGRDLVVEPYARSGWATEARAAAAGRARALVPGCHRAWAWVIGALA